ncbi:cytochrome P450 [Streptomyces pathocidini]|uniref:Cytochrome P450 n=1 Tax=Streptomyces pathocidini TaxID=1650571 RepID=A0ABW7UND8_9ACTN|nr:cytochrome P450 [Streptomyces pathocidini]
MNTSPDRGVTGTPVSPPPGCPAHGLIPELRRLDGPEAEADPMALYESLRKEHGTVAPVMFHGDVRAWLVLGHRENLEVMRNPFRYSRDSRMWRDQVPQDHPLAPITQWQPLCNFADGDDHRRLRGAVTDSIARFNHRGIRGHVNRYANQLIDRFAASGRADLVADFAVPLPMLVMVRLVGLPEEYGPRLVDATRDMLKGTETAVASNAFITDTLQRLVERKRADPGHDFASWLLEHKAALSDEEVREHLRLVLIAAFETTANLIANTLSMNLTDQAFQADIAGGQMTLPDALEQVLWDKPSFELMVGRWATGDTRLGGQDIKAGDMLVLGLAAGNVDPEIRPDLSDPVYGNRSHLAFGGGDHECPGQEVGRAIAEVGIDALLHRLQDVKLAIRPGDLAWRKSSLLSSYLVALPVEFSPHRPRQSEPVRAGDLSESEPRTVPVSGKSSAAERGAPERVTPQSPALAPVGPRPSWWRRLVQRLRGQ